MTQVFGDRRRLKSTCGCFLMSVRRDQRGQNEGVEDVLDGKEKVLAAVELVGVGSVRLIDVRRVFAVPDSRSGQAALT